MRLGLEFEDQRLFGVKRVFSRLVEALASSDRDEVARDLAAILDLSLKYLGADIELKLEIDFW